jgi:hypothetical protein
MNKLKALWASAQGNPSLFKKINGWLTVFWIIMIPVSIAFGWVRSVEYVSALSIYALITGHLSTWQAARVEVKQEQQDEQGVDKKVDEIHQQIAR